MNPVRLAWRQGKPAPDTMTSYMGAAVVHNNTVYFSIGRDVYSYTISEDKWSKLKPCSYEKFSMVIVDQKLTTVGGRDAKWWRLGAATNTLLSLSSSVPAEWKKLLPPMPTKRVRPAAVTTPTHLVVAGGRKHGKPLSTTEVLNLNTYQWASVSSSPKLGYPSMTLCGGHIYLSGDKSLFSCSVKELVESCEPASTNSSAGDSVWIRLPDTPAYYTTLATLRGRVLSIGGSGDENCDTPTKAIHCYDRSTNSWSAIEEMPTPRHDTLVAVLPSNKLVVVGGEDGFIFSRTTEIGYPLRD